MTDTTPVAASSEQTLEQLEQAVNAASEQTEGTQSSTEVEASAENAPDYGQAFKDLAEKKGFKSVDDLVRSYKAAESRSTKAEQARAALEQKLEQANAMKDAGELNTEQEQALRVLESTIDKVLSKKLAPIQEIVGVQKVDRMIADLQSLHPDFTGAVVDETLDIMMSNKSLSMEDAYKLASWEQVKNAGQSTAKREKKVQDKTRAFTESANQSKTDDIDYSKLSLEELENILPSAGDYIDHKGMRRG